MKPLERAGGPILVRLVADPSHDHRPAVEVGPGGSVTVRWRGWGYARHELTQLIIDAITAYFASLLPQPTYYWRGTHNPLEPELIRTGQLRPSRNHATGEYEPGLSVAEHLGYVAAMGYEYGYRVRGQVIATGSDGEPVLALDSLEPLDDRPRPVQEIEAAEGRAHRDALRRAIAAAGWTGDQYRAALAGWYQYSAE